MNKISARLPALLTADTLINPNFKNNAKKKLNRMQTNIGLLRRGTYHLQDRGNSQTTRSDTRVALLQKQLDENQDWSQGYLAERAHLMLGWWEERKTKKWKQKSEMMLKALKHLMCVLLP